MTTTQELNEKKLKAIDYAKNYPLVTKDSPLMGPVTVGNVGEFNGRVIINLCLRTAKSNPYNAAISFPKDWSKASQFKPGDQVNIRIHDGFVQNIWIAKPEPLRTGTISAAAVNQQVTDAVKELRGAIPAVVEEKASEVTQEVAPF
jgi:hypothetical protein